MKKFVYINNKEGCVVFVCQAENILSADKQYKRETGEDPIKQHFVGVIMDSPINKSFFDKLNF